MGPGRDADKLDERLIVAEAGVRELGHLAKGSREDTGRHGIPAFELGGAAGGADLSGPEEVLERGLDQRPVPAPLLTVAGQVVGERLLDLAARQRASRADLREDGVDELGVLPLHSLHATPGVVGGAAHAEVEQRPRRRRDERGLVRPVLDQPAGRAITGSVDQRAVVGAEARVEGEVVAARDDVDAVDLHDAHGVDDPLHLAGGRAPRLWPRDAEALGGKRDPTGRRGAESSCAQASGSIMLRRMA